MAIFVFSQFRAFVIDSSSSHHNSLHGQRRGVEVEEQADAEAGCAQIRPLESQPESLVNGDGRLDDPRGKRLEVMAHRSCSR